MKRDEHADRVRKWLGMAELYTQRARRPRYRWSYGEGLWFLVQGPDDAPLFLRAGPLYLQPGGVVTAAVAHDEHGNRATTTLPGHGWS